MQRSGAGAFSLRNRAAKRVCRHRRTRSRNTIDVCVYEPKVRRSLSSTGTVRHRLNPVEVGGPKRNTKSPQSISCRPSNIRWLGESVSGLSAGEGAYQRNKCDNCYRVAFHVSSPGEDDPNGTCQIWKPDVDHRKVANHMRLWNNKKVSTSIKTNGFVMLYSYVCTGIQRNTCENFWLCFRRHRLVAD